MKRTKKGTTLMDDRQHCFTVYINVVDRRKELHEVTLRRLKEINKPVVVRIPNKVCILRVENEDVVIEEALLI